MSLKKSFIKSRNSFKVTFKVPEQVNPDGRDIRVLGSFNNWSWDDAPSLKPSRGTFKVDVELEAGKEYSYRYLVDRDYWVNDVNADAYEATQFDNVENCVVILEQPETAVKKPVAKKTVAKKPVAKKSVTKKTEVKKSTTAKAKPAIKKTTKVDFKKIEGVGPKIAKLLTEAGYTTYEDLANAKKKDLTAILSEAGKRFQMHDPSTWAKQSKLLAQGNLDELAKLQAELKGGKKA